MKNKEIEKILNTLDGIASGDWIQMLPKEANLLLSYIEQLENNRDKAIEYIKEKTTDDEGNDLGYSDNIDYEILSNILKGDSDE